jgi:hypothetical protein
MRITTAFTLALLCSFSAEAQTCTQLQSETTPCQVTVGKPFTVTFDQADTTNVAYFRLFLNGNPIGVNIPVGQLVSGVVTVLNVSVPAKGAYVLEAASANLDNQFVKSAPLKINAVLGVPTAPSNLKITIEAVVGENGVLTGVRVVAIEEAPK